MISMNSQQTRSTFRTTVTAAGLLLLGIVIGRVMDWPTETQAQPKAIPDKRPKAFLSGGARSAKILRDIHGTLKQLDARVARIEKHLQKQND